jgi:hypothetical protein
MTHTPPGSPGIRALVALYQAEGSYPKTKVLSAEEFNALCEPTRYAIIELHELLRKEHDFQYEEVPIVKEEWIELRSKICELIWSILETDPQLITIQGIQQQAIEKGSIPDPDPDESGFEYYRLPDWTYGHWKCGNRIACRSVAFSVHNKGGPGRGVGSGEVRSRDVPYCPACDKPPAYHGGVIYD